MEERRVQGMNCREGCGVRGVVTHNFGTSTSIFLGYWGV